MSIRRRSEALQQFGRVISESKLESDIGIRLQLLLFQLALFCSGVIPERRL
jgi:hypothetical protein